MKSITVLLAEDHMVVREGLRALLEAEGDIEIICEARTGREAIALNQKHRPDVVLIDVAMPVLNGLQAARQILREQADCRVLVLSAHEDDAYIEHALETGVAGYLVKQSSSHMLAAAVRAVATGKTFFSPSVSKRFAQFTKSDRANCRRRHQSSRLTSRESEILQLIAEGRANKQTAAELGISIKTVEKHRQALMNKLGVHDTAGLTRYAISAGIIENSAQRTI